MVDSCKKLTKTGTALNIGLAFYARQKLDPSQRR